MRRDEPGIQEIIPDANHPSRKPVMENAAKKTRRSIPGAVFGLGRAMPPRRALPVMLLALRYIAGTFPSVDAAGLVSQGLRMMH